MNSIVDIINNIQKRPAMYIGRNSISCLKSFLDGWYLRNPEEVVDGIFMEQFQIVIERKYEAKSSKSWSDILLYNSQDESKALELFFKEFDEYKKKISRDG